MANRLQAEAKKEARRDNGRRRGKEEKVNTYKLISKYKKYVKLRFKEKIHKYPLLSIGCSNIKRISIKTKKISNLKY